MLMFAFVFLLTCSFIIIGLIQMEIRQLRLEQGGQFATASLTGTVTSNTKGGPTYYLDYSFEVEGRTFKKSQLVPLNLFNKYSNPSNTSLRNAVLVRFLPSEPSIN